MNKIRLLSLLVMGILGCGTSVSPLGDGQDARLNPPEDAAMVFPEDAPPVPSQDAPVATEPDGEANPLPTLCGPSLEAPVFLDTCQTQRVLASFGWNLHMGNTSLVPECAQALDLTTTDLTRLVIQVPGSSVNLGGHTFTLVGRITELYQRGLVLRLVYSPTMSISLSRWVWSGPSEGGWDLDIQNNAPNMRTRQAVSTDSQWFSMTIQTFSDRVTVTGSHPSVSGSSWTHTEMVNLPSTTPSVEIEAWGQCDTNTFTAAEVLALTSN